MQMSAMKACFQIAECSLSSAKIRIFSKRAYTWFSEDFTIIGDLFHFAIFHFHALLIILLALSGWRLSERDANNSRA
jgi:hypothetical protein